MIEDALRALVVTAVREALGSVHVDPWLDLEAAADHAGIGREHWHVVRDACRRGELPSGKAGRTTVVRRSDVDAWLVRSAKVETLKPLAKVDDERAAARAEIERAAEQARRAG